MPVIVATMTPKPDQVDEVRAILVDLIPEMHQEPGCKLYSLHEAPGKFVFVEEWADDAAMAAHGAGPAIGKMFSALDGRLDGPPDLVFLTPVPAGDPALGQLRP
ncbi:putative quinol monooxygenase [Pseudofrankia sp. DC12]|uniref:putative quinol monooxygenase n=1 Tax=Pseudofrankia sp. DC12 TaxID=683315 RepID=UPI0005F894C4|nr:putative quinol monooxygenase [Pseudofrankia sp. DC12]